MWWQEINAGRGTQILRSSASELACPNVLTLPLSPLGYVMSLSPEGSRFCAHTKNIFTHMYIHNDQTHTDTHTDTHTQTHTCTHKMVIFTHIRPPGHKQTSITFTNHTVITFIHTHSDHLHTYTAIAFIHIHSDHLYKYTVVTFTVWSHSYITQWSSSHIHTVITFTHTCSDHLHTYTVITSTHTQ